MPSVFALPLSSLPLLLASSSSSSSYPVHYTIHGQRCLTKCTDENTGEFKEWWCKTAPFCPVGDNNYQDGQVMESDGCSPKKYTGNTHG